MITRDLAGGLAAIIIGAVYLFFAYGIRASALDDSLGPGGMPRAYGWLLVAFGLALAVQGLVRRSVNMRDEWAGQGGRIAWAAGLLCFGIAYLLIVEALGYLVSISLLIIGVALYQGAPAGGRVVLIGIGGAIFLWCLFSLVLGVSMPGGMFATLGR